MKIIENQFGKQNFNEILNTLQKTTSIADINDVQTFYEKITSENPAILHENDSKKDPDEDKEKEEETKAKLANNLMDELGIKNPSDDEQTCINGLASMFVVASYDNAIEYLKKFSSQKQLLPKCLMSQVITKFADPRCGDLPTAKKIYDFALENVLYLENTTTEHTLHFAMMLVYWRRGTKKSGPVYEIRSAEKEDEFTAIHATFKKNYLEKITSICEQGDNHPDLVNYVLWAHNAIACTAAKYKDEDCVLRSYKTVISYYEKLKQLMADDGELIRDWDKIEWSDYFHMAYLEAKIKGGENINDLYTEFTKLNLKQEELVKLYPRILNFYKDMNYKNNDDAYSAFSKAIDIFDTVKNDLDIKSYKYFLSFKKIIFKLILKAELSNIPKPFLKKFSSLISNDKEKIDQFFPDDAGIKGEGELQEFLKIKDSEFLKKCAVDIKERKKGFKLPDYSSLIAILIDDHPEEAEKYFNEAYVAGLYPDIDRCFNESNNTYKIDLHSKYTMNSGQTSGGAFNMAVIELILKKLEEKLKKSEKKPDSIELITGKGVAGSTKNKLSRYLISIIELNIVYYEYKPYKLASIKPKEFSLSFIHKTNTWSLSDNGNEIIKKIPGLETFLQENGVKIFEEVKNETSSKLERRVKFDKEQHIRKLIAASQPFKGYSLEKVMKHDKKDVNEGSIQLVLLPSLKNINTSENNVSSSAQEANEMEASQRSISRLNINTQSNEDFPVMIPSFTSVNKSSFFSPDNQGVKKESENKNALDPDPIKKRDVKL